MHPARVDSSDALRGWWRWARWGIGGMALWALTGHAVAAGSPTIYRCTVNGQTVYQQSACNEGRALAVEAAPTAAARQAQDQDTARLQRAATALEVDRLRRDGRAITARTRDASGGKSKSKGSGQAAPMGTAPAPATPAKPKKLASPP